MFFDLIALSCSFFTIDFHIAAAIHDWSRWKTTMTRR
nr:MAG TPA: hypothetical protein [Caudoviricetes sp.]DAS94051.1 MAG TPA: hypothetical protein [Caudoviricetes sp.]